MRNPVMCMGCLAVALSGVSAWGAEFVLQPISASGSHTIVGTEIRLSGGGQRVFLEVKLKSFAPSVVKTYQATLDAAGYMSGAVGTIAPAVESCPSANAAGNTFCQTAFGDTGTGASRCLDFDPGPGTDLQCEAGWLNKSRTDWIFFGHDVAAAATDISTLNYRWGGALFTGDAAIDDGSTFYGGRLAVDVPANAVGTFTIGFVPGASITFMADENNAKINPLFLTPGRITVPCTNPSQCDDGNFCTDDTCDGQGNCVNTPNYNQSTQCCDPNDPTVGTRLETISDGNECTSDSCNPDTGDVAHTVTVGADCGPPGQTLSQCDLQDTCDAGGQCQTNLLGAGASCGSTTHTECDFADTCNGAGTCLANIQPAGTLCGSQTAGPCDAPNTCNATGTCLDNFAPNNSICDDALFCTDDTRCNATGVCGVGVPHNCSDARTCTTDTCVEDAPPGQGHCENELNPGFCLIAGVCFTDGDLDPAAGRTCFACDPSADPSDWTALADGTLCNDGNACTGTGRVDIDPDTCNGGVCLGELDPQCNDQCEFAVPAVVGQNLSTNATAGDDGGVASCQVNTHADVWFEYTATCDGAVFISTTGSDLQPVNDPVLNVYTKCPLDGGVEIACDDDSGADLNAALTFATTQNEAYYIRVSGFGDNRGLITMNLSPSGDCLIGGDCYAAFPLAGSRNPENDCLACIPQISTTDWSVIPEGTACGDPTDTECSSPDACDGFGECELNHKTDGELCSDEGNECTKNECEAGECAHPNEPNGLLCGDQLTDTDCDNPDTCEGGTCVANFEGPGFACGDQSNTQCDKPDACNGIGICLPALVVNGTTCNDGDICTGSDHCETGVCVAEPIPQAPLVEAISSRHLRVTPQPTGSVAPVALRVTSPTWPCLLQWIDADGNLVGITDRVFQTPDVWDTVLVQDPDVVPSSFYEVVAECGAYESEAGSDQTYLWGDINNDGFVDFEDISVEVNAFKGIFILPLQAYDVFGCTPDGVIDFNDISDIVNAFKGVPFPCSLPCHD